jgi:hypothetical protein
VAINNKKTTTFNNFNVTRLLLCKGVACHVMDQQKEGRVVNMATVLPWGDQSTDGGDELGTCALAAPGVGQLSADVQADHLLVVGVVVNGVAPLHGQRVKVKLMPLDGGVGGKLWLIFWLLGQCNIGCVCALYDTHIQTFCG